MIDRTNVDDVVSEVASFCSARVNAQSPKHEVYQQILKIVAYTKSISLLEEKTIIEVEKEIDMSNGVECRIETFYDQEERRVVTIQIEVEKFVYRVLENKREIERAFVDLLDECVEPADEFRYVSIKYAPGVGYRPRAYRYRIRDFLTKKYNPSNNGHVNDNFPNLIYHEGFTFKSSREVSLYNRLKELDVLISPLPAFTYRHAGYPKRVEPDFIILKGNVRLLIEIDGESHENDTPEMQAERRAQFELSGFHELRFTNQEIDDDLDRVMGVIEGHLNPPQTPEN